MDIFKMSKNENPEKVLKQSYQKWVSKHNDVVSNMALKNM
jgi:hypothetical protein